MCLIQQITPETHEIGLHDQPIRFDTAGTCRNAVVADPRIAIMKPTKHHPPTCDTSPVLDVRNAAKS